MTDLKIKIYDHKILQNQKVIEITKDNLLIASIIPKMEELTIFSPCFFGVKIDNSFYPEKISISLIDIKKDNNRSNYLLFGFLKKSDYNGELLGIFPTIHEAQLDLERIKKKENKIIDCSNSKCVKINKKLDFDSNNCPECSDSNRVINEYNRHERFQIQKWSYNWKEQKHQFNKIVQEINL